MRSFLSTVRFNGTVVIDEGEKDEAPMLYNGKTSETAAAQPAMSPLTR